MGGPQITLHLLRADRVLLDGGIALPLDVTHDAIVEALSDLEARCGPLRAGAVMVARWGTHARAADYRGNRHDGGRTVAAVKELQEKGRTVMARTDRKGRGIWS
ncbi:MAG: hypothetical protein F4Y03_18230 [Alphaproteobacteria bacterium]|nr:hypothetical protein [Alphaproteobacteria bacterium]